MTSHKNRFIEIVSAILKTHTKTVWKIQLIVKHLKEHRCVLQYGRQPSYYLDGQNESTLRQLRDGSTLNGIRKIKPRYYGQVSTGQPFTSNGRTVEATQQDTDRKFYGSQGTPRFDPGAIVLDESRSFFRVHTGYFSNIPKCIKAEFIASWACSQSSVVSSSKR
ncbi:hypothetical protein TNCV_3802891 [Trichonephila clavipes]|nr:hypothetical protein TNCV_3802891 [Trichonephila clavipes]